MTHVDLELARDLGRATRTYIDQRLETVTAPLVQRIQELERAHLADDARIKMLEARPTLEYKGLWNADESYAEHAAVTHNGCVWISKAPSHGIEPGSDPRWQLAVRKGRDARR